MKQYLHFRQLIICLSFLLAGKTAYLQNVGINIASPKARLQVGGSFMVSSVYDGTTAAIKPENQLNMINAQTIYFENDSIARFFDPGGPSGNYLPNMTANARCSTWTGNYSNAFLEITIENLQLGTGDSLKISELTGVIYRVGNTTINSPLVINSNSPQVTFTFQSNADASVGTGFSIKVRMLYLDKSEETNTYLSGYGMAYHATDQSIRLGSLDQRLRGTKSIAIGEFTGASGSGSIGIGSYVTASGPNAVAFGYGASASGGSAAALGPGSNAYGDYSVALGSSSYATGDGALAVTGSSAVGSNSFSAGTNSVAEGNLSLALGQNVQSKSFCSIALGRYNRTYSTESVSTWEDADPLLVVGKGTSNSTRSNALYLRKDGRMGIGTDLPGSDLHIRQSSGGGLMLENGADGNRWRIYSASGDNNLTFYNHANVEIADIDDETGTYSAISDARLKKEVQPLQNILPILMQLVPTTYLFNWQDSSEEKQIGMLAQEAYKLFPQLVSYDKEKDLYKINYAGFSTVAIRAIQEQQAQIELLKKRLEAIEEKLAK